jgi:hypothetical protein
MAGISSLKSLQISQYLLISLIAQILVDITGFEKPDFHEILSIYRNPLIFGFLAICQKTRYF